MDQMSDEYMFSIWFLDWYLHLPSNERVKIGGNPIEWLINLPEDEHKRIVNLVIERFLNKISETIWRAGNPDERSN